MTRAIELAPDNVKYYCQRAFLSKPEAAIADYNKALELDPNNKYIYLRRAESFDKLEKYSEALADFDRAIELLENFHGTTADLSDIEYFIRVHFYGARAEFYWRRKNYAAALEDLNQAVGVVPYEKKTYYERGVFYWNIGEKKKAKANFIQASVAVKEMERAVKRARRIPKKFWRKRKPIPARKESFLRPEDLKGIL